MARIKEGTICHIELPAPDIKKACSFYEKCFGWKTGPAMGPSYVMFTYDGGGGAFDADLKPATGGPILIIEADDIDSKLKQITKAGGAIVKEKTEIGGGHGWYAYFTDPCGNKMGVHQSS